MTSIARIAGVEIDLSKVPDRDEPAGSHLRSTGTGYTAPDGTEVADAEIVVGPRPDAEEPET
jgi:hypothetical protein